MAEADRFRWNERYAERAAAGDWDEAPVPRLLELERLIRPRRRAGSAGATTRSAAVPPVALDLACGTGRHTLYLARLGYTVDAWDISDVGLERLARLAREQGLAGRVRIRQVDLDEAALPVGTYDLVVDTYFLDRRLFRPMAAALKPGGLLFMETLLSTPERPGRPDYYLQPSELRAAFPELEELFYRENEEAGWAAFLGRKNSALEG
jgi:SAM-dependent methyltransferase